MGYVQYWELGINLSSTSRLVASPAGIFSRLARPFFLLLILSDSVSRPSDLYYGCPLWQSFVCLWQAQVADLIKALAKKELSKVRFSGLRFLMERAIAMMDVHSMPS